jgi:hypothetical protein
MFTSGFTADAECSEANDAASGKPSRGMAPELAGLHVTQLEAFQRVSCHTSSVIGKADVTNYTYN